MRTIPADRCNTFPEENMPDNRTGIIRYEPENTDDPTSTINILSTECSDEPYESLKPKLPWTVGEAVNPNGWSSIY